MAVTSSEKLIKAACKPKKGAPKAKYLDPIIASTQVPDGPISDLCAALAPRLREPQVDTVFKALLVLHSMIRSGGTDNVLEYLARMDVLRLKSVGTGGFWEGYSQTETLTHYAHYLHARITAYRELKHDMVRVQAENNRASAYRTHSEGASERARKLRSLTVEKGLLRETRQVQKIIDALVRAEWYKDDLQDECTVLAFRMMVKDLLVLFQAGNEGIINLLEHYFEMEHKQAADALTLYKSFCTQTKKVVEYLKYAKELNNIIDVPIPNLKHAPVSLVKALQEYLDDPNFEENRSEYKQNKDVADGKAPAPKKAVEASKPAPAATSSSSTSAPAPSNAQSNQPQALVDFFSSIEENQPTMFNPQTNSPTSAYFEQQATFNPFAARLQQQQTGLPPQQPQFFGQQPSPFGQQQMPMQLQPQATGFAAFGGGFPPPQQPQFGLPPQQQQQQLQPQATGFNPFRQSMLMPQATGFPQQQQQQQPPMPSIPSNGFLGQNAFAQQQQQSPPAQQQPSSPFDFLSQPPPQQQQQQPSNGFLSSQPTGFGQQQPLQSQPTGHHSTNPFGQVRSATSPPSMQPLVAQPTGSKNPFAPAGGIVPPMPTRHSDLVGGGKGTSLHELAFGGGGAFGGGAQQQQSQQQQQSNGGGTDTMSSLASSFALNSASPARPSSAGPSTTLSSNPSFTSSFSSQPQPLQPQATGYAGSSIQPFKPSSTFGASLLSSLPETTSPGAQNGGGSSYLSAQPTGAPNPFRQSTLPSSPSVQSPYGGGASLFGTGSASASAFSSPLGSPSGAFTGGSSGGLGGGSTNLFFGGAGAGAGGGGALQPQATGFAGSSTLPFKPSSSFGMSSFGGAGGGQQQQGGGGAGGSLI
ncbi:ANTH domain-containing protein [Mrakia frigida]|uniref:ANTH domain-containing protein n=1 Tax=Mrakia frigida TaxID=29902 RepID=UPI003FCC1012